MNTQLNVSDINGPVVIIAPHPDDETLGCGGLIAALVQNGTTVHTIFVTDGSSSHRNSKLWPPHRLSEQRQKEAVEALLRLGAANQPRSFLGLKDANMPPPGHPSYESAVVTVIDILEELCPDLVLAPWRRDPHCDHRDAWFLVKDALNRSGQNPKLLEYTIWLEELGAPSDFPGPGEVETLEFSMPELQDIKRRAIMAHTSQLGKLISDDPSGFFLTAGTLDRLIKPNEIFWRYDQERN